MVCVGVAVKRRVYQREVDVDNMLYDAKSVLADVSSVSPSSEKRVFSLSHSIVGLTIPLGDY